MLLIAVTNALNEERVIGRCLNSTKDLVDRHLVIDTGSSDSTKAVAAEFPHAIVAHAEWVDFGANLTAAIKTSESLGAEWVLRVDADETVHLQSGAAPLREWLATAEEEALSVHIKDPTLWYRRPDLTRSSAGPWTYVGRTHEYLDIKGRKVGALNGMMKVHHADGGSRSDKFTRDEALLRPEAEEGDIRAMFYLAQTLHALGKTEEAIEWYKKRADDMSGWEEERWYAQYRAASLAEDVEDLIKAWRNRPHRPEPLERARQIVAKRGSKDSLFLEGKAWSVR